MPKLLASFQAACQFIFSAKTEKSLPRCIKYDPRFGDEHPKVATSSSLHYELVSTFSGDRSNLEIRFRGEAVSYSTVLPSRFGGSVIRVNERPVNLGNFSLNKAGQKIDDFNQGYPLSEILKHMDIKDPVLNKVIRAEKDCCYMQQLPSGRYDIFPEEKNQAGRCTKLRDFGALAI